MIKAAEPRTMMDDDKFLGKQFSELGSSSLANYGGLPQLLFYYLLTTYKQIVSR
jgi:hypothetical protein